MEDPLLEAEDLTIQYQTSEGPLTAVSNASFTVERGDYFGLIGESGSGKSTVAKSIIGGLDKNGDIASGKLYYKGTEIQDYSDKKFNEALRWKEISFIPQSAMNSLDPFLKVKDQAAKLAKVHGGEGKGEAVERIGELFEIVGLNRKRIHDYPHTFSGGMQQRAVIAFALLLEPNLIIADEPTTALDVIMQDQFFKHLENVKEEMNTSMLLITHDISIVFESCEKMAVMHAGQVAESGEVPDLYDAPHHPYLILLQEAFPDHRYPDKELEVIEGDPPQSFGEVDYCTFVDRCPWAIEECREREPPLESVSGDTVHRAACVRKGEQLYEQLHHERAVKHE